ncbi:hypothetical protein EW026_g1526 [Hermanssonia centrifuga]|uniref:Helicase C-terminal domain-containing protein n=1 Tax=Hermanssonia centrifuga TaxID=98765 RepID=A0A4S4KR80_9APHY|nr:hypothetical protein EW026_g1526 [Hermanssonia centrifuga]
MVPVALTEDARELYDAVEALSKERVGNMLERNGGFSSAMVQSNVLSMLTRLRQLALHPGLVPPNYVEQLRITTENEDTSSAPAIQLTAADKIRLQGLLAQAIEDNEECPICFGILAEPRITACSHCFCLACITEDRRPITIGDLIEPPPPTELTQAPIRREEDEDLTGIRAGSSAKIDQLIHLLKLTPSTEKSLVFSQFTSFLDKIAENLEAEGISYVRFDGKMSAKRRQETIAQFSVPLAEDESPALLLTQAPSQRPTRTRSGRSGVANVNGADYAGDNGEDGDYVMSGGEDDDFIDDADEESRPTKGKGKGKKKAKSRPALDGVSTFGGVNPKVMLISLKAGALGLNLTVANNVYLMDPWWQEGIESQAIDRCNRIGQTKPVHVYQMIAENTVESKVIEIQEKKKLLVKQG